MCRPSRLRSRKKSHTGRSVRHCVLSAVVLAVYGVLCSVSGPILFAEEADTTIAAPKAENEADAAPPPKEQREKAMIGLMVLVGIATAGLGLLALVILWGHRIRRISRLPLPQAERGDELFYLKQSQNHPPGHHEATTTSRAAADDDSDNDSSVE